VRGDAAAGMREGVVGVLVAYVHMDGKDSLSH
jgi:hypothetical protein